MPFSGYTEQLVLEMPYDKEGRPVPRRANIYRLSTDQSIFLLPQPKPRYKPREEPNPEEKSNEQL